MILDFYVPLETPGEKQEVSQTAIMGLRPPSQGF